MVGFRSYLFAFCLLQIGMGGCVPGDGSSNVDEPDDAITQSSPPPSNLGPSVGDPTSPESGATFEEQNGAVVMEAESATLPPAWTLRTDLAGYTGTGYLQYEGNDICLGPATDQVRYSFKVNAAGTYRLKARIAKYHICVTGTPRGDGTNICLEEDRGCDFAGLPENGVCEEGFCTRRDIANDMYLHFEDSGGTYVPFVGQPADTIGEPMKFFGGADNVMCLS